MNQELLNYIRQDLEKGKSKEQIWEELKRAGWQEEKLKRAFQNLGLMEMDVLPGIGDLLERIFQVYKDRFWTLVGIMLPPFLLGWIGYGIWWFLSLVGVITKMSLEDTGGLILFLFLILFGLIFFVVLIYWEKIFRTKSQMPARQKPWRRRVNCAIFGLTLSQSCFVSLNVNLSSTLSIGSQILAETSDAVLASPSPRYFIK